MELDNGKYLLQAHDFSLFLKIQEITLPVKKLQGSTIAMITAHEQGPHMRLSPGPWLLENSRSGMFMLRF